MRKFSTRWFRGLRVRLLLLVVLAAVPAIALLTYNASRERDDLGRTEQAEAIRMVQLAADYHGWLVNSTKEVLSSMATAPVVANGNWSRCSAFMSQFIAKNPRYSNMGVASISGEILCSALPVKPNINLKDRAYFQRALRAKDFAIGEYQVGRVTGLPSVGIGYPLVDSRGRVTAIVYAALRLSSLQSTVDALPPGREALLLMFDRNGQLLAKYATQTQPAVPAPVSAEVFRRSLEHLSGTVDEKLAGEQWIFSYAAAGLPDDPHGLTIALGYPVSRLVGAAQARYRGNVAGLIGVVLAALLAGWLGAEAFVLKQIKELAGAIGKFSAGDFRTRARNAESHDELGRLAQDFNQMADQIESQMERLQSISSRLSAQNRILQLVSAGKPNSTIFLEIVEFAQTYIPGAVCSIMLLDEQGKHLTQGAGPALPADYIAAIDGVTIGPNVGSCGTSAYTGQLVVAADIDADPRWADYKALALRHGLRACWSTPIFASTNRVLGTLAVYYREVRRPTLQELELVELAGGLAAIAIEQTQAKRALVESEHEYRYLFERNPNPMWIHDAETRKILAVNDAAIQGYGFTREEFLTLSLADIQQLPVDDGASAAIESQNNASYIDRGIWRHRKKSGECIDVRVKTFRIRFQQRDAQLLLLQDVTSTQRAIAALAERDRQLELLLESTAEAIYGIDTAGRCTFVNRACITLLGFEREDELLGKSMHELVHHPRADGSGYSREDCPICRTSLQPTPAHKDDEVFWRRDGTAVPVEYWSYPMRQDSALVGAVVTFFDITERKAQRAALQHQATHDALTGLPNRALLAEAARRAIEADGQYGRVSALMLMDLDRFKEVNDTLGHQAGDQLLAKLAERLASLQRPGDIVVRLGGDEFAFIVTGAENVQALQQIAHDLLGYVRQPFDIQGARLQIDASIGIAIAGLHGSDAGSLLRCADVAMYAAKQEGRGVAVYERSRDPNSQERLALTSDVRLALAQNQFELFFQPKVDLGTGRIVGAEALLRWRHPTRGLILPSEFIQFVELGDMIHPLTRWVAREAALACRRMHQRGCEISVCINVSTRNLLDEDFPQALHAILDEVGLAPCYLELEVTESAIMLDPLRSRDVLERSRAGGIKVSIDDFGTGYSSLGYLQALGVDGIKIDQSFVRRMFDSPGDMTIVKSIVSLAQNLGCEVIAEGIEDRRTLEMLRLIGCDIGQGYYFGRPMPLAELLERMSATERWEPA